MRSLLLFGFLFALVPGFAQPVPGSLNVRWNEGAPDCSRNTQPPLQVHTYNASTYIIRENPCVTFEAPFMYLLIGSQRALLIDSGDVSDPQKAPLAATVMQLLGRGGPQPLPLLVAHTHRHLDHRAGDAQFVKLPNVEIVGFDLQSVQRFFGFKNWPDGIAEINLGDRIVDALPTPGHSETEVSYYDRQTGLFFSGDFLLPGHLLIDDTQAYLASARRAADFVKDRPVTAILGGHIEMSSDGQLLPWKSTYHPNERALPMTTADLLALPAALEKFNGFYSTDGQFVMMNSIHILEAMAVLIVLALMAIVAAIVRSARGRRRRRLSQATPATPFAAPLQD